MKFGGIVSNVARNVFNSPVAKVAVGGLRGIMPGGCYGGHLGNIFGRGGRPTPRGGTHGSPRDGVMSMIDRLMQSMRGRNGGVRSHHHHGPFGRIGHQRLEGAAKNLSNAVNKMENLSDKVRAELGSREFNRVETVIDRMKSATNRLASNPRDRGAIRAFETATDQLQRTVQGLNGKVNPSVYRGLQIASNRLEGAADALNRGPMNDFRMSKVLNGIAGRVNDVTRQMGRLSDQGGHERLHEATKGFSKEVNKLENLSDYLKGELGSRAFDRVETAIDGLKAAASKVARNPHDANALRQLETRIDQLKQTVGGLKGDMNPQAYRDLQGAVNRFEHLSDQLNRAGGMSDGRLARVFDGMTNQLGNVTDQMENMEDNGIRHHHHHHHHHHHDHQPVQPVQPQKTWQVDKKANTVKLDNGYSLKFDNKSMSWHINDAKGNSTRIWGDPHVKENDGGKWDFKQDSSFILNDGTKISVNTTPWKNGTTVTDSLTITKGDQSLQVSGIAKNQVQIGDVKFGGRELDAKTNDGYIFREENGVDDWVNKSGKTITSNQAMGAHLVHEEKIR